MTKALPKVSTKGYRLIKGQAQLLAFHGYTGSPYDLRPLADALHAQGLSIHVPLLRGHGTTPDDLFDISAKDWLHQANAELDRLSKNQPVILAGLSMGALIAIILSQSHKNIAGLVLISPALRLNLSAELIIGMAKLGLISEKFALKKMSGASDINDPIARKKCPSYHSMPVHGLLEFEKLRRQAESALPDVTCPAFIAFAGQDGAIDVESSRSLILTKSRAQIISKTYVHSKHVLPLDFDRELLATDIWHFLQQTLHL